MLTTIIASLLLGAPTEWHCYEGLYGDGYTCDCGCGLTDPDCGDQPVDRARCNNNFCPAGEVPMLGSPSTCVPNTCGDGFVTKGEACDDGAGEGCDDTCQTVAPGYRCSGLGAGCSVPRCGDGFVDFDRGERCDDGNEDDGDGCDGKCLPEPGWICHVFGGCTPTLCGDGNIEFDYETQSGESCEDGGADPGDGCDQYCHSEPGWVCRFDGCVLTVCGDGIVARGDFGGGEQCDDKGTKNGDGCDEHCQIEPGWQCDDFQGCYQIICGDGVLAPGFETCDDGDSDPGDGCDDHCQAEAGWNCYYQAGECHQVVCGDRVVEGDQFGSVYEECDDGNTDSDDGCSSDCRGEPGWVCDKEGCRKIQCGDGHVDGNPGGGPKPVKKVIIGPGGGGGDGSPEQCDDGNTDAGDGCDAFCQIEPGWVCEAPNQPCVQPVCGDSSVNGAETCDDGNGEDGDGCSQTCVREPDWVCRVPGSPCEKMPTAWVCSIYIYGAGDGCDCGCGAADPDCPKPLTVGACEFAHCLETEPYPAVDDPTTCSKEPPPVVEPEPEPMPETSPEPTPEPEPEVDTVEPAPDTGAETAEAEGVGGGRSSEGCAGGGGTSLLLALAALPLVLGPRRRR